jgi:hypothetical protein
MGCVRDHRGVTASLPSARAAIAGGAQVERAWYQFFQSLQVNTTDDRTQAEIDALDVRVTALESDGGTSTPTMIRGSDSITVSPGAVQFITLTDMANSGSGSLLAITVDAQGRIAGYRAATSADLPSATGTSGEALVADGISGPPVMLTNEAADDFIFQG